MHRQQPATPFRWQQIGDPNFISYRLPFSRQFLVSPFAVKILYFVIWTRNKHDHEMFFTLSTWMCFHYTFFSRISLSHFSSHWHVIRNRWQTTTHEKSKKYINKWINEEMKSKQLRSTINFLNSRSLNIYVWTTVFKLNLLFTWK